MTEIYVVRHDNSHRYRRELDQYFRGRYDVFVREGDGRTSNGPTAVT